MARQEPAPLAWKPSIVLVPVAIFVVAKTLAAFATIIQQYLAITYDLWFEIGMVVGQVVFQWIVMWRRTFRERLDYAFVLIGVSALGAVLLWPLLLLNRFAPVTSVVAVGYFFAVVGVMFVVHYRLVVWRMLPKVLCASWVAYRLLILAFVLKR